MSYYVLYYSYRGRDVKTLPPYKVTIPAPTFFDLRRDGDWRRKSPSVPSRF